MSFAYDFHVHTSRYSSCSQSPPEAMCRKALEIGLAGIALTEHDRWWPVPEIEALRKQFPDLGILQGVEFSCPEGHFLVFLPESISNEGLAPEPIRELIRRVHGMGGIVIWAHPFRYDRTIPDWLPDETLDGIEVASTNMNREASSLAVEAARAHGIARLENSDAHVADSIGMYKNKSPYHLGNNADLIEYVRKAH